MLLKLTLCCGMLVKNDSWLHLALSRIGHRPARKCAWDGLALMVISESAQVSQGLPVRKFFVGYGAAAVILRHDSSNLARQAPPVHELLQRGAQWAQFLRPSQPLYSASLQRGASGPLACCNVGGNAAWSP